MREKMVNGPPVLCVAWTDRLDERTKNSSTVLNLFDYEIKTLSSSASPVGTSRIPDSLEPLHLRLNCFCDRSSRASARPFALGDSKSGTVTGVNPLHSEALIAVPVRQQLGADFAKM